MFLQKSVAIFFSELLKTGNNPHVLQLENEQNVLDHTMEYYSAIKRKKLLICVDNMGNLSCVILSEKSQTAYWIILFHMTLWKRQSSSDRKRISDCLVERLTTKGHKGIFAIIEIDVLNCGDGYMTLCLSKLIELCTKKSEFYCM